MLRLFAAIILGAGFASSAATANDVSKPIYSFGTMRTLSAEAAMQKCRAALEPAGGFDLAAFDAIWSDDSRPVFDRTVESLLLGNNEARTALEVARNPLAPAPTDLPQFIKDTGLNAFIRANLATAYAKALSGHRVYEEALDSLKAATPELVVDPSQYFFYRAVAEHALMKKDEALGSIARLIDDVADAPDRYRMVATLIYFDMQNWSADRKDLANIGRLMDNSGRRLDLARGGKVTQDIQKKIIFALDEKIKELENQSKGNCNGGSCPSGGSGQPGNTNTPSSPQSDSQIGGSSGAGKVDEKKLRKLAEEWGKLPPAERAKAIQEISKDLPPKFKPMIEDYFKSLNKIHGTNP